MCSFANLGSIGEDHQLQDVQQKTNGHTWPSKEEHEVAIGSSLPSKVLVMMCITVYVYI